MLNIGDLTGEAFAPDGQVIVLLHTGRQGAGTNYDPDGRRVRVLWEDPLAMGICSPVIGHTWSDDAAGMRTSNNVYSRPLHVLALLTASPTYVLPPRSNGVIAGRSFMIA